MEAAYGMSLSQCRVVVLYEAQEKSARFIRQSECVCGKFFFVRTYCTRNGCDAERLHRITTNTAVNHNVDRSLCSRQHRGKGRDHFEKIRTGRADFASPCLKTPDPAEELHKSGPIPSEKCNPQSLVCGRRGPAGCIIRQTYRATRLCSTRVTMTCHNLAKHLIYLMKHAEWPFDFILLGGVNGTLQIAWANSGRRFA